MKTLLASLVFLTQASIGLCQIAQESNPVLVLPIGQNNEGQNEFLYSHNETCALIEQFLPRVRLAKAAKITFTEKEGYQLKATVQLSEGWGSVAITLIPDNDKLGISENSCAHVCFPDPESPCGFAAETVLVDPCVEITCACMGEGKAKSENLAGDIIALKKYLSGKQYAVNER